MFRAKGRLRPTRGRLLVRVREHQAILGAIKHGDPDRAAQAADKNIQSAVADFLDRLNQTRSMSHGPIG
jgi:DNA-binding GntR family transcriptional regulator